MNRTNFVIAAIAAAGLLVIASAQTQAPKIQAATQVGRYQLLSGESEFIGKTTVSPHRQVFRIDTATGQTTVYATGFDENGKAYQEWQPIR